MKKTESDRIFTLRKCVSNQRISMEIIPEFSSEPYFVRKQQQQNKFSRVTSLTPRKNKFIEIRKYQSSKEKLQNPIKNSEIQIKQEPKTRKFNSPFKIQNILVQNYQSQRQINIKIPDQIPLNQSQQNYSDQKLSSSKSVRFSNRIDDTLSINSRRQGSRTPSIFKKKNKKPEGGLTSIPSQRSFSANNSFHSNHKQMKRKIAQQSNANNIVKKKYESILKGLEMKNTKTRPPLPGRRYFNKNQQQSTKEKFKDDIFPPVYSSIFPPNPKISKGSIGKQIQWRRISEMFPDKKLIVYDRPQLMSKFYDSTKQQSKVMKIRITKQQHSYASEFIVTALNSIKNNEDLLCKMFQNQQINEYGIYLVKIFQENAWKYIIVDDFIPVVKSNSIDNQGPYMPAFISVKPQVEQKKQSKKADSKLLPIWPFLLQKAYANYYSSYEALTHGQFLDMVSEFCGISYEKINLVEKTDPQEYLEVIDKLLLGLKNGNVVVLAQLKNQLPMIPLHYKAEFCYSMITEQELSYYDPHQEYKPSKIKFYDLGLICTHLFLFTPVKYLQQITCTISKPKHKVSTSLMTKINQQNIIPRDIPTIRKFTLKSACQCSLYIRQKQKRFIHRLGIQYVWLRVILIAKQYDGSYRWIDGQYSNNKGLSFNHVLDPGEYYIFLYPQWGKEKYNHQIHISLYCNEQLQSFQRVEYDSKQKMIEHACMDLAQKQGKLKQINQFICTYNLIDKKSALIIQNIINQRLHGEVNIVRSITGLKSTVDIVPVNDEFYQDLKQKLREQGAQYLAIKKSSIEVTIAQSQSYTVILKMKGGIDNNFLKVFNFGS